MAEQQFGPPIRRGFVCVECGEFFEDGEKDIVNVATKDAPPRYAHGKCANDAVIDAMT